MLALLGMRSFFCVAGGPGVTAATLNQVDPCSEWGADDFKEAARLRELPVARRLWTTWP